MADPASSAFSRWAKAIIQRITTRYFSEHAATDGRVGGLIGRRWQVEVPTSVHGRIATALTGQHFDLIGFRRMHDGGD